jgi:hypothetical protein
MAVFFVSSLSHAACPRFPDPKTPDQVWQNDQDLDDCIHNLSKFVSTTTTTSNLAAGSTNYIQNRTTLQSGTTAYPSFIYVGSSATIPNAAITNLNSSTITTTNLNTTTETWRSFGILPILQIQEGITQTSSNTNSASYVTSLLSVTITPKLSTSKILVLATGKAETAAGSSGYATLARGTTNLATTNNGFVILAPSGNDDISMLKYDSPATTSATTYSVRIRTDGGGSMVFPVASGTPDAVIWAVEIAQ